MGAISNESANLVAQFRADLQRSQGGQRQTPDTVKLTELTPDYTKVSGRFGEEVVHLPDIIPGESEKAAQRRLAGTLCHAILRVSGDEPPEDPELDAMMGIASASASPVEIGADGIRRFHACPPEFTASRRRSGF